MKFTTKEIILIGIFAAITAVLSQISITIPFSPVPVTMQIFAVCLAAAILGSKCGTFSQTIYILLGLLGAPVFAGFSGGLGVIFGPAGGFIVSFPIMAFIIGIILERKKKFSVIDILVTMILGLVICYTIGASWLAFVLKLNLSKAIAVGVAPFIPLDILKILAASFLAFYVRRALVKANLLQANAYNI